MAQNLDYSHHLISALGECSLNQPIDENKLKELSVGFSENFISLWRKDGFACYGGLFFTFNPLEIAPLLSERLKEYNQVQPFARDSFGNIFFLAVHNKDTEVYRLDIHKDIIDLVSLNADFLFDMQIYGQVFVKDFLYGKKYNSAQKKCGILALNECYTFLPALALGGSGKADSVKKVKFLEQLSFLVQLHEE